MKPQTSTARFFHRGRYLPESCTALLYRSFPRVKFTDAISVNNIIIEQQHSLSTRPDFDKWTTGAGWVSGWVCYHDNSNLRASILTKLRLYVKVVTISRWLNFGRSAPPGRGLRGGGENFWLRLITASAQCLRLSERFFTLSFLHC